MEQIKEINMKPETQKEDLIDIENLKEIFNKEKESPTKSQYQQGIGKNKIIISFLFFMSCLSISALSLNFSSIAKNVEQQKISMKYTMNNYNNMQNDYLFVNGSQLSRAIQDHHNLLDHQKEINLLLLSGRLQVYAMQVTRNSEAKDVAMQAGYFTEQTEQVYKKEKLNKNISQDKELLKRQFSQLVQLYQDLPDQKPLGTSILGNILNVGLNGDGKYIKDKIALSLYKNYLLIENFNEIESIFIDGFSVVEFLHHRESYWENNFSAKYGKEIPKYLDVTFGQSFIYLEEASSFIKDYKTTHSIKPESILVKTP